MMFMEGTCSVTPAAGIGHDKTWPSIELGRGTRLRALDEQTLVPPGGAFFQYSKIPTFHYSLPSYSLIPAYSESSIISLTSFLLNGFSEPNLPFAPK
jgi:hypothetical protein